MKARRVLAPIVDGLDDSMLAAGSEAYGAALSYYQSAYFPQLPVS